MNNLREELLVNQNMAQIPTRVGMLYVFDGFAASLSVLCLIHCIALPVLSITLPFTREFAAPWVHQALVGLAIPITLTVVVRVGGGLRFLWFRGVAMLALCLLALGAFFEPLSDHEAALTVLGATLLATAHAWRLLNRISRPHANGRGVHSKPDSSTCVNRLK